MATDKINNIVDYDAMMTMIIEYGVERGRAGRDATSPHTGKAWDLLHEITVNVHRLYAARGDDV